MQTPLSFPQFQTKRLLIRELTFEDSAALFEHFSDPDVTRFMDIDVLSSEAEAVSIINFHAKDSGCRWGLFWHENGELIGSCGYHCWERGESNKAEIGYDLAQKYWGMGLMQEAIQPILKFGFNEMGLSMIEAEVEKENAQSSSVLKKLGFKLDLTRDVELDWFILFKND
ncbi:MAG: ribosomal-protein-alanine N-acetyltransferase [Candidatus Promineifilaceae bacterium]|jgi:ribosomal-protein-alanine N-acetyltransferase